jgi:4-hydroxythreonine-4-phosphate dehydrogenase
VNDDRPRIAVTLGDPAGIGPEVVIKALRDPEVASQARWTVVGSKSEFERHARALHASGRELQEIRLMDPGISVSSEVRWGEASAQSGRLALSYIEAATKLCLSGEANAMVTAPVNKEAVVLAGEKFSGHTEYIAMLCGAARVRMLLSSPVLNVVHVSTHRSLRRACDLDAAEILTTIQLGEEAMKSLGIARPRIAVCGLNPHAGENGLFGDEDQTFIAPAVRRARELGSDCSGPLPADTLFMKATRGMYDLVVAMYHDQGHIPMKLIDFENTVNVSLGLPIIRTSVDHGTAFDIVGRNIAEPANMKAAMKLAVRLAIGRKKTL